MACRKVYLDAYFAKNHDRDNSRKTKWRKENPVKAKAAIAKWTEANKDRIKIAASTCNLQKGMKHPIDFMQSRGFLL